MISLFVAFIRCLEEPEGLITLNRILFRRYVETREPYQPWIVAFTRNGSKKCAKCIPILEQVASRCYGYMFVGQVDQDKEVLLAHDYDVTRNWTAFLFHKDGCAKITAPCDAHRYYRWLVEHLPDDVLEADLTWIESSQKKPSVILFTSRFKVPHMWRAIAGYFKDRNLRVGLVTEQEMFNKFGVTSSPTVLYLNKSGQYRVHNVPDYKALRNYIVALTRNKPPPVKATIQRFFLASQFAEECVGNRICVFHASQSIDPRFALKETRFTDERLRFFSGAADLPYSFMRENEVWIFKGDRTGLNPVRDFQDVDDMIKFTLRGALKWTPMAEYHQEL